MTAFATKFASLSWDSFVKLQARLKLTVEETRKAALAPKWEHQSESARGERTLGKLEMDEWLVIVATSRDWCSMRR
jgi:hypothetical protein